MLELLSKGKSYTVIADELFIHKETVKSHIKNIYFKLQVHSKADAIEVALKKQVHINIQQGPACRTGSHILKHTGFLSRGCMLLLFAVAVCCCCLLLLFPQIGVARLILTNTPK